MKVLTPQGLVQLASYIPDNLVDALKENKCYELLDFDGNRFGFLVSEDHLQLVIDDVEDETRLEERGYVKDLDNNHTESSNDYIGLV